MKPLLSTGVQKVPLRNATHEALEQVLELISLVGTNYDCSPGIAPSPIGKHIRHVIDHLWAFQAGLDTGCIDYNLRHRETAVEHKSVLAVNHIRTFMHWLESARLDNKELTVISEISVSHCESSEMRSNINREMAYLINHTLHHVAYANLLAKAQGLEMPDHLGIAPATASYLRDLKEPARCAQSH